jgi:hypothetical protein
LPAHAELSLSSRRKPFAFKGQLRPLRGRVIGVLIPLLSKFLRSVETLIDLFIDVNRIHFNPTAIQPSVTLSS